jgi:hypothetical protein
MQVISIRKKNLQKLGYRDLKHWLENENNVYIGRYNRYVDGTFQSKWHNPFSAKIYGRDGCIKLFKEHLLTSKAPHDNVDSSTAPRAPHDNVDSSTAPRAPYDNIGELKGKTLGCWCKPEACHGDVLVEFSSAGKKLNK